MTAQPISILLCALGGEGGGVLTQWLVEVARHAGYAAQATSIPGVAQRTGATTYYLEVFPVPIAQLGGKRPVFGLNPLPGRIDLLVASELLEAARQVGLGLASTSHTVLVASSARALTTLEKMAPGDGRQSSAALQDLLLAHSRRLHLLDMAAMAREAQTVTSSVMLGAIAASGVLPFARADYEAVIGSGGSGAATLRGFALALEAVQASAPAGLSPSQPDSTSESLQKNEHPVGITSRPRPLSSLKPEAAHDFVALGRARVLDYQNAAYAQLFDTRVARLQQAESAAPGRAADANSQPVAAEAARWLALWMCYDDIVRVADLKSRALRTSRVRLEARAQDGNLLQVYEHFKPGVAEFASLLPSGLARRLRAWDARRVAAGREPWALPLRVGSHTVLGMLSLRLLANLKGLRPASSRYAEEQELIERWLAAVEAGTTQSHALGWELAQCGRLIKGYGSTNERAKANLLHIVAELAAPQRMHSAGFDPTACAAAVAAARESALKDATGKALDQALQQHGAAPRPIAPRPIRWVRKPPARHNAPVA